VDWIEIFKPGSHTSSSGLSRRYPQGELQQVVETYDPNYFKAPLIVSHDTAGYADDELHATKLAYGFPEKLKVEGGRLWAGFKNIAPKFKEWVRNGQILGVSSSFYLPDSVHNPYPGKLSLRHVAGCGADVPAIKGMAPIELCEGTIELSEFADYEEEQEGAVEFGLEVDDETLEDVQLGVKVYNALRGIDSFGETPSFMAMGDGSSIAVLFKDFYQRVRDRFIEEKGVEEADKVYPTYMLDQLAMVTSRPGPTFATWEDISRLERRINRIEFPGDSPQEDNLGKFLDDYSESEEEEFMPDAEEFEEMRSRLDNLETKSRLLERENERLTALRESDRVAAFCEDLVRDRKLLPSKKESEIRFILSLDNSSTADYGEEGELTPREAYLKKLSEGRELWSNKQMPIGPEDAPFYSEKAPAGFDAKSTAQDRQVKAYAKEHNLTYSEAIDALVSTGALS
jgi:hypothetical protein